MSRLTCLRRSRRVLAPGLVTLLIATGPATAVDVPDGYRVEVVVSGVPRPAQLALDASRSLVILSHGWEGASAAEVYRVDLADLPLDAGRRPRLVIPFSEGPRKVAFGSLAVDPRSGDLFLGEENGNRIYRLVGADRLSPFAAGLNHLLGGSTLAFDPRGRLVVLDYASPEAELRSEAPPPASFEGLSGGAYHGPVVIRVDPTDDVPLPRRLGIVAPLLPKGPARPPGIEPLFRFISVATLASGDIVALDSVGEVLVVEGDGRVRALARLPAGHYHRTSMAVGPGGDVFVSGGFQIRRIFRVSPTGVVTTVARNLGDPEGIAVDEAGNLYVAENALHRVIRISPPVTPPPASPR